MTPQDHINWRVQQVAVINAEYEEQKRLARAAGRGHSITREIVARRHGLNSKQLVYYRTNHLSPSRQDRSKYAH